MQVRLRKTFQAYFIACTLNELNLCQLFGGVEDVQCGLIRVLETLLTC